MNRQLLKTPFTGEPVALEVITEGRPVYWNGRIINTTILLPPLASTARGVYKAWYGKVVGEGLTIDTAQRYAIYLDIPGIGEYASKPSKGEIVHYTLKDLADMLYRTLTLHFPIQSVRSVIGCSYGGVMAYHLAKHYPDFIKTIVPISAPTRIKDDHQGQFGNFYNVFSWVRDRLQMDMSLETIKNCWSKLVYFKENWRMLTPEQYRFGPGRLVDLIHPVDYLHRVESLLTHDITPDLSTITPAIITGHDAGDILMNARSTAGTANSYYWNSPLGHHSGFLKGPGICPPFEMALREAA